MAVGRTQAPNLPLRRRRIGLPLQGADERAAGTGALPPPTMAQAFGLCFRGRAPESSQKATEGTKKAGTNQRAWLASMASSLPSVELRGASCFLSASSILSHDGARQSNVVPSRLAANSVLPSGEKPRRV